MTRISFMLVVFTIAVFFTFTCFTSFSHAQLQQDNTECLIVSGTFEESVKIWKSRWELHNGTIKELDMSTISNRLGCYVLQEYLINGKKCWKQIGNNNHIWFGHALNPINSYDVWYVGSYPYDDTPLTQRSIPCSPTFVPNREGRETVAKFLDEKVVIVSLFDPSIRKVFLSQLEIDSYGKDQRISQGLSIKSIEIHSGELSLVWDSNTNMLYDIYGSTNLLEKFFLIHSNLTVAPMQKVIVGKFSGDIGFYKITEKAKIPESL